MLVTLATRIRQTERADAVIDHRMHHALRHHAVSWPATDPDTGSPVERPLLTPAPRIGSVQSNSRDPARCVLLVADMQSSWPSSPRLMTQQAPSAVRTVSRSARTCLCSLSASDSVECHTSAGESPAVAAGTDPAAAAVVRISSACCTSAVSTTSTSPSAVEHRHRARHHAPALLPARAADRRIASAVVDLRPDDLPHRFLSLIVCPSRRPRSRPARRHPG
ncbi:hypothetical protein Ae717Ps2_7229c [Pseudonocardia sp. Ae717_Ps2]|nr:hypothetical protein Ae717Ps2_7229c [Pseudonocardia sp. Ae717_Ps2]